MPHLWKIPLKTLAIKRYNVENKIINIRCGRVTAMLCAKSSAQWKAFSLSFVVRRSTYVWCVLIGIFVLQACSSAPKSRYSIKQDTAPTFDYGQIEYEEIQPTFEPYNVWTSRPYKVLGQYYTPLISGKGHVEIGQASWYGQKFHGHKTANGEIFDMFALSAAHKTLPLPSFVKVTNLSNNKSAIVRINDRGPFHDDRVLDLSYGAAKKLGYHKSGVADIKLEVIHVSENGDMTVGNQATIYQHQRGQDLLASSSPAPLARPPAVTNDSQLSTLSSNVSPANDIDDTTLSSNSGLFVQVMAMENEDKVKSLAIGLKNLLQVSTTTPKVANIYKLQLGPLKSEQKAKNLIEELSKIGFDEAFTIEVATQ